MVDLFKGKNFALLLVHGNSKLMKSFGFLKLHLDLVLVPNS